MTEIDKVDIFEKHEIEAQGEDIQSLLFHLLDEFLFLFSAEPFFIARVNFTCPKLNYSTIFILNLILFPS
jgi:SHS2 domain-containing protein